MSSSTAAMSMLVRVPQALQPFTDGFEKIVGRLDDRTWRYVPAYTGFLIQLFVFFALFWRKLVGVDARKTPFLATYFLSTMHSIMCVVIGYPELKAWAETGKFNFDIPNTPVQCLLLQFNLAYMIVDTLCTISFLPFDFAAFAFHMHHFLAAVYLMSCLYIKQGAMSSLFTFFIGEVTGVVFNIFNISKELKDDSPIAAAVFKVASPVFTFTFVGMRSVVAIPVIGWFLYRLIAHSPGIPLLWRLLLATCVIIGMYGSQVWSYKLIKGFRKHMGKDKKAKDTKKRR